MRVLSLENLQQFAAVNVLNDPGYLPGPKIIPNAAMVRLNWQLTSGKVAHNILYATYTGTPALSVTIAQTMYAALIAGANWSTLAGFLAPTTTLTGVTLLDVRSGVGVEYNSTGAAVPGTSTGTALPDEVAFSMKLSTINRGPSGRGRIYIPGWATNSLATGNVIAGAAQTAANIWCEAMRTTVFPSNIGALVLGLPHRQAYISPITGRSFPERLATTVPVTSFVAKDNHWDSQRRRGLK
jgi:hypothetical protein